MPTIAPDNQSRDPDIRRLGQFVRRLKNFALTGQYSVSSPVTSNTTLTADDFYVGVDASGGPVTISLPAAAAHKGRPYHISKRDATVNAVTVDGAGAETINGAATQVIIIQYTTLSIISDGVEWAII